jgi:AcrR family transcriptional regulator
MAVMAGWRLSGREAVVVNLREHVLDATLAELNRVGVSRLDLSVISDRSGVSQSAITRYIGGIVDLLDALTERLNPGFDAALRADRAQGVVAEEALHRHFARVITALRDHPGYAAAELAVRRDQARTRHGARRRVDAGVASLLARVRSRPAKQEAAELAAVGHQLACLVADDATFSPSRGADRVMHFLRGVRSDG